MIIASHITRGLKQVNTDLAFWDLLKQSEHPFVNLDKGQIIRNDSKYYLTQ